MNSIQRQITDELAEVLSLTSGVQIVNGAAIVSDKTVEQMVQECDLLVEGKKRQKAGMNGSVKKRKQDEITLKQQNLIMMLAKTAKNSVNSEMQDFLIGKLLATFKSIKEYSLEKDKVLRANVPLTHEFMKELTQELLEIKAKISRYEKAIRETVWGELYELEMKVYKSSTGEAWSETIPALMGIMEALESDKGKVTQDDVAAAVGLVNRQIKADMLHVMNGLVANVQKKSHNSRGRISLTIYAMNGYKPSGNMIVTQMLRVLQKILSGEYYRLFHEQGWEMRRRGKAKNSHQKQQRQQQQQQHLVLDSVGGGLMAGYADGIGNVMGEELDVALDHEMVTLSKKMIETFLGMRTVVVTSVKENEKLKSSVKASADEMMILSLRIGTLISVIRARIDEELLKCIFGYIRSAYSSASPRVMQTSFEVLAMMAEYFEEIRDPTAQVAVEFVVRQQSVLEIYREENTYAQQVQIMEFAATALCKAVVGASSEMSICTRGTGEREGSEGGDEHKAVASAMHELLNTLLTAKATGLEEIKGMKRRVAVTLAKLATLDGSEEIIYLALGMLLGPVFKDIEDLNELLINCIRQIGVKGTSDTRIHVITIILGYLSFRNDSWRLSTLHTASNALVKLINTGNDAEGSEQVLTIVIRAFISATGPSAAAAAAASAAAATSTPMFAGSKGGEREPKAENRLQLKLYLPILLAASSKCNVATASAEIVSLWRQLWFHLIINGLIEGKLMKSTEKALLIELAQNTPLLVHPTTVNYLETELEYSLPSKTLTDSVALATQLRGTLNDLLPTCYSQLKYMELPQLVFLMAVYYTETSRAKLGSICSFIGYFSSLAVKTSKLLSPLEEMFKIAVKVYLKGSKNIMIMKRKQQRQGTSSISAMRTTTADTASKKSDQDDVQLKLYETRAAGNSRETIIGSAEKHMEMKLRQLSVSPHTQLQQLIVLQCHYMASVSKQGVYAINEIVNNSPFALLDKRTITLMLEMSHVVWMSCKAELDDQFVPVYHFTTPIVGVVMQFPDSMNYRRNILYRITKYTRRWLGKAAGVAPVELQALLCSYLALDEANGNSNGGGEEGNRIWGSSNGFGFDPHIGRSMALEIGRRLNQSAAMYGAKNSAGETSGAIDPLYSNGNDATEKEEQALMGLYDNTSAFLHKFGEQRITVGRWFEPESRARLKAELSKLYSDVRSGKVELTSNDYRVVSYKLAEAGKMLVRSGSDEALDIELVRLLVWVPVTIFKKQVVQQAIYVWTDVIVERPEAELAIIVEISIVWHWLLQENVGIFTRKFEPKNPFEIRMSYEPSDNSSRSRAYNAISTQLLPHRLLISFLHNRLDAAWYRASSGDNRALADTILRILQLTFDNAESLSSAALARYERFQLIYLALKVLNWNFPDITSEVRFREKMFDTAFLWFSKLPKWSFSGSKAMLLGEVRLLINTHVALQKDKLSPLSSLPISDTINREAMFSSLSVPTTPVAPARLAPSYSFPSSDDPFPAQQMQSAAPSASSSLSNPALHMMAFPDNRNFGDALISGGGNSTDKPESTNHFSLSNTFGYNQPATTTNTTTSEDGNNNDNNNNNNQQRHHRRFNSILSVDKVNKVFNSKWSTSSLRTSTNNSSNNNNSNSKGFAVGNAMPDIKLTTEIHKQLESRFQRNQALLLLLLESEIRRIVTWANPINEHIRHFSDVGKFVLEPALSQDGWRNLVRDAWVADPKLAIYLPVRFSNPAVVNELQSLVHAYPGELVSDPESLKFFMGLLGSSSNSNSNTNANIDTDDEDERFGSGNNTRSLSKLRNSFGLLAHKHSQQYPQHEGKHQLVDDSLVQNNSWIISLLNDPAKMDMGIKTFRELKFMLYYISVPPVTSISLLSSDLVSEPLVLQYAMRSLEKYPVEVTFFNVPQLVQALRFDKQGYVEAAIVDASKISQLFAHQIIWNIKANSYKDDEGKVPDMQIKPALDRVTKKIIDLFSLDDSAFYKREFSFFTKVTAISGSLKPYIKKSKGEKKKKIDEEMQKIVVDKGVYLPSNPDCTVVGIDYLSGRPLQSHAKAPFMATFYIQPNSLLKSDDVQELVGSTSSSSSSSSSTANSTPATTTPSIKKVDANSVSSEGGKELELQKLDLNFGSLESQIQDNEKDNEREKEKEKEKEKEQQQQQQLQHKKHAHHVQAPPISKIGAIFKVGDDCRQDMLALQLIAIFKNIFASCGLDLYLFPYRVVATSSGCGIIEVIPNSISRDQLGREKVNSLYDYFVIKYGGADSIQFQQARSNFVQSLAAYSVLSYLLAFKDRHNGNIMIDDAGHLIHIDFGFILGIAPGGITFESAPFKLTAEYIQVMGGSADAQPFKLFCELCVKAFLSCRSYCHYILQIVEIMVNSGLPCFGATPNTSSVRQGHHDHSDDENDDNQSGGGGGDDDDDDDDEGNKSSGDEMQNEPGVSTTNILNPASAAGITEQTMLESMGKRRASANDAEKYTDYVNEGMDIMGERRKRKLSVIKPKIGKKKSGASILGTHGNTGGGAGGGGGGGGVKGLIGAMLGKSGGGSGGGGSGGSGGGTSKGSIVVQKLASRFALHLSEREAAKFMMEKIQDSYKNKRTVMYDSFQKATNGIPY